MKPLDPRLLRHAGATKWFLVLSVGLGVLAALLMIGQAMLISAVVVAGFQGGAHVSQLRDQLLGLVVITLARSAVSWASAQSSHRAGAQAVSQLRLAVLGRLLTLGPSYLTGRRTGELVALTTRGVGALGDYFAGYLPQLVLAVVVPLVVGTAILTQDVLAAVILALTIPVIPAFMILIGQYTQSRVDRQWQTLGVLSGHFLDVVTGLPTLKLFGRARAAREAIATVGRQYRLSTMGVLRVSFMSALVLELLATLSVAIIAVAIGLRLVSGDMDLQTGLTVLILAPEVYLPLRLVGAQFHAAAEGLGAAERMFEVLEESQPQSRGMTAPSVDGMPIRVVDLTVSYGERAGVEGVSFTAHPGQVTALVGPSGCGKSTVLAAILGLVGPPAAAVSGRIELLGPGQAIALSQLDLQSWRAQVGYVPQSPAMLVATVADNVRLGRSGATDDQVAAALLAAGLAPQALRDGLATQVGEGGAGLSVGQARRVGVARALLRDPAILLFDEPSAALDAGGEADLTQTLVRLARAGRTVLVVTHRRAMMAVADQVVHVRPHAGADPDHALAAAR